MLELPLVVVLSSPARCHCTTAKMAVGVVKRATNALQCLGLRSSLDDQFPCLSSGGSDKSQLLQVLEDC